MALSAFLISLAANLATDITKLSVENAKASKFFRSSLHVEDIQQHVMETLSWCEGIQFYGMHQRRDIKESTIPLRISGRPRMFSKRGHGSNFLNEDDLMNSADSVIILGDPGSGKTTTIKRMIHKLITEGGVDESHGPSFPIFLAARDLQGGRSISDRLAEILKLEYLAYPKTGGVALTSKEKAREDALRERRIQTVTGQILSRKGVVLIVDGIDEVEVSRRRSIFDEIELYSRIIVGGKVVASCRSGEFMYNLEGFSVVEILPLSDAEIDGVIESWSNDPSDFKKQIETVHYKEVLDRPLFLAHLITLHDDGGRLPKQSSDVYRLIINLLLERWDLSRRIDRTGRSSYGSMGLDQKNDVLASLGFHLLVKDKLKYFSHVDIGRAYKEIAPKFGLDIEERNYFIRDIESHTGLIVQISMEEYGFSHFSLHEYLSAYFLVRQPSILPCVENFIDQREVVAIAACLSSSKEDFLLQLMAQVYARHRDDPRIIGTLKSFLHRLRLESRYFVYDVRLGLTFLILLDFFYRHRIQDESTGWFSHELSAFSNRELILAIGNALKFFTPEPKGEEEIILRLNRRATRDWSGLPNTLFLHTDFYSNFMPELDDRNGKRSPS